MFFLLIEVKTMLMMSSISTGLQLHRRAYYWLLNGLHTICNLFFKKWLPLLVLAHNISLDPGKLRTFDFI